MDSIGGGRVSNDLSGIPVHQPQSIPNVNPVAASHVEQQGASFSGYPLNVYGYTSNAQMMSGQGPTMANEETEEPLYVNAKQYNRILKRRATRAKQEHRGLLSLNKERKYLHESRHNHAKKRRRTKSGRFVKKSEIEQGEIEEHASEKAQEEKNEKTQEEKNEGGKVLEEESQSHREKDTKELVSEYGS